MALRHALRRIVLMHAGVAFFVLAEAALLSKGLHVNLAPQLALDTEKTLTIIYALLGLATLLALAFLTLSYRSIRREHELVAMKSDFVAAAAHELRSPLTSIRWTLSGLQNDTSLSPQAHATVNQTYERVRALIDLTNTFLIASSTEYGVMRPDDLKVVDIVPTILKALEHSTALARMKNIKINVLFSLAGNQKIVIKADAERLRLVFENLLSNAIKYSPQGSSIELAYEDRIDTRLFLVRDHGIGIPAKFQKSIFTGFQRAENAKQSGILGSGFGIFMVKKIIDFHGGKIWCTSEVGKGTAFSFIIPSGV